MLMSPRLLVENSDYRLWNGTIRAVAAYSATLFAKILASGDDPES
jgi:hypothetical protein